MATTNAKKNALTLPIGAVAMPALMAGFGRVTSLVQSKDFFVFRMYYHGCEPGMMVRGLALSVGSCGAALTMYQER